MAKKSKKKATEPKVEEVVQVEAVVETVAPEVVVEEPKAEEVPEPTVEPVEDDVIATDAVVEEPEAPAEEPEAPVEPEPTLAVQLENVPPGAAYMSDRFNAALAVLCAKNKFNTGEVVNAQATFYRCLTQILVRTEDAEFTETMDALLAAIKDSYEEAFVPARAMRGFGSLNQAGLTSVAIEEFSLLLQLLISTATSDDRHATASAVNWRTLSVSLNANYADAVVLRLRKYYNVR